MTKEKLSKLDYTTFEFVGLFRNSIKEIVFDPPSVVAKGTTPMVTHSDDVLHLMDRLLKLPQFGSELHRRFIEMYSRGLIQFGTKPTQTSTYNHGTQVATIQKDRGVVSGAIEGIHEVTHSFLDRSKTEFVREIPSSATEPLINLGLEQLGIEGQNSRVDDLYLQTMGLASAKINALMEREGVAENSPLLDRYIDYSVLINKLVHLLGRTAAKPISDLIVRHKLDFDSVLELNDENAWSKFMKWGVKEKKITKGTVDRLNALEEREVQAGTGVA